MKRKKRIILFCMMAGFVNLYAQQISYLSLSEALSKADAENRSSKMAVIDQQIALSDLRQTDAIFLPQVSVNYNAVITDNPLNAFGFLLQQSGVSASSFEPDVLNHPSATHNFSMGIEVKMPLLNLDLIYARKAARFQEEVYKYKAQYTKDYVSFEVKKAYTQLQFAHHMKAILMGTKNDVEQIYQSVKNFYDQGLLQKSDVLNAQVQVNTIESALVKAESSISNASEAVHLVMGLSIEGEIIYLTDSLTQNFSDLPSFDCLDMRSDMMAMSKAVEASEANVKSAKMRLFPKINAFGNYQFNEKNVVGLKNNSYLAGINLTWNVFSGNENRQKIKSAMFQRNKMQEEFLIYKDKSRQEVAKVLRDMVDLQAEIKTRKASVEKSEEALRIMTNRHKEGLVSTTDLLQSQAQLSQQQLQYAQTIMSYNITFYYYELLTKINK